MTRTRATRRTTRVRPGVSAAGVIFASMTWLGCAPAAGEADEPAVVEEEQPMEAEMEEPAEPLRFRLSGYDLTEPAVDVELPKKLDEVSGLVAMEDGTLACIQDERGALYLVDGAGGDVLRKIKFAGKGDFEAICRSGRHWFALISAGEILQLEETVEDGELDLNEIGSITPELPHDEYEALAHDPLGQRLLLAPKDRADAKEWKKSDVLIYALGLERLEEATLRELELALHLNVKRIEKSAADREIPLPTRRTKAGHQKSDLRLRVSDLAVHPLTGEFFVLSGPDRTLLAFDREGALVGSAVFPESLLAQPEGVAFATDGRLFLTSEGVDGGRARLLAFRFEP